MEKQTEVGGGSPLRVKVKRLSEDAKIPVRSTAGAGGFDMFATSVHEKGDSVAYKTDIAMEIPEGYAGFLFPRSSVVKTKMHLGNSVGLIDSDFRGNITFVFYKRKDSEPYKPGERCGQIVIMPIPEVVFEKVEELSDTARGEGGYGSTGK